MAKPAAELLAPAVPFDLLGRAIVIGREKTDEPNAVKNGSHHQTPFAQPTALPFGVWK